MKEEEMKELLKELVKELKEKRENAKEGHKEEFAKRQEDFRKMIDEAEEAMLVVTENKTGLCGEPNTLATLFTQAAEGLLKSGIPKAQLLFDVELASLDNNDEDYAEKVTEIMNKYLGLDE